MEGIGSPRREVKSPLNQSLIRRYIDPRVVGFRWSTRYGWGSILWIAGEVKVSSYPEVGRGGRTRAQARTSSSVAGLLTR